MPPPAASSTYTRYETRRRDPNPRTAALLVIDVQGQFASLAAPALQAIATTVALCRGAGIPVIYTRHVDPVPRSRPLAEWWAGDHISAGTPAAELLPGAGRAAGDLVVIKQHREREIWWRTHSTIGRPCLPLYITSDYR
ncbi:hypothetical protein QYE76_045129 [Lolium multiflorum]|uniref:Isochorismatase-like domain-containing protein n=1 Tax=Lolium multiflorum TaxID=4521 RepID=A0AAD8TME9_LOLMU|nr:hypothetical protein QYE76_045129 [Lolium multiflorum]